MSMMLTCITLFSPLFKNSHVTPYLVSLFTLFQNLFHRKDIDDGYHKIFVPLDGSLLHELIDWTQCFVPLNDT